jgi:transposase
MYYVGIDIAKRFHIACVIDDENKLLKSNYRIESDISEFSLFYQLLNEIDSDKSKYLIGMEATGLLFDYLYFFLIDLG